MILRTKATRCRCSLVFVTASILPVPSIRAIRYRTVKIPEPRFDNTTSPKQIKSLVSSHVVVGDCPLPSLRCSWTSGKLYSYNGNARTTALLAVAKANALDVEVLDVKPHDEKLVEEFPLGRVPGFIGADGYKLHECTAIAIYCKYTTLSKGSLAVMSETYNRSVIPV